MDTYLTNCFLCLTSLLYIENSASLLELACVKQKKKLLELATMASMIKERFFSLCVALAYKIRLRKMTITTHTILGK